MNHDPLSEDLGNTYALAPVEPELLFDEADLEEHDSDEFVAEDIDLEDDLAHRPHAEVDLDDDDEEDDLVASSELSDDFSEHGSDDVDGTHAAHDADDVDDADKTPTWGDLGVPSDLARALDTAGITTPFPIQIATLPDALAGKDICGEAPTGSGKTLAYGIVAVSSVGEVRSRRPHALVLVPVRELAEQTSRALQPLSKARNVWVQTCVGGVDIGRQANALRKGVGIVVATPGRLIDLLSHGDISFDDLRVVVIDEADRMADMGFLPQVEQILSDGSRNGSGDRAQVLLFSATLDGDVGELVRRYQHQPVRHSTAGVGLSSEEDHVDTVGDHLRVLVRHESKIDVAAAIAEPARRSLMFVKNRFASERVADALNERGVTAAHLHGGLTQGARNRVITSWARGDVRTVVATDMVARGLHMDHVDVVVHLDAPQDEKDYIHRSGRTGRAGAAGTVVNLIRKEQKRFYDALERRLGVTSREALLDDVVDRLREQVKLSEAAPVSSRGATPLPVVEGAVDYDQSGGQGGWGRDGGRDGGRDSGRDRGGFQGGRGQRPSFGRDRGNDRGPSRGFDRGPERGSFDRSERPPRGPKPGQTDWIPQEEWQAKRDAERASRGEPAWLPQAEWQAKRDAERADRAANDPTWIPQEEWQAKRDAERAERGERPFQKREGSFDRGPRNDRPFGDRGDRGDRGPSRGFDRGDRGPSRGFDRNDRGGRPGGDRPGGDRPWIPQEEWAAKKDAERAERGERPFQKREGSFDRGPRAGGDRPWVPQEEWNAQRAARGDRPWVPQEEWDARNAQRDGGREGGRPGGFDRGPSRFGGNDRGGSRDGGRPGGFDRGPRSFDRNDRGGPGGSRDGGRPGGFDRGPARSFDGAPRGPRPFGGADRGDRTGFSRPERSFGGGAGASAPRGDRPWAPREPRRDDRPSNAAPGGDRWDRGSSRPAGPARGDSGFGGRPSRPAGAPGRSGAWSDRSGAPARDSRPGSDGQGPDRPGTNGYVPRGVKMWQAGRRNRPDA